MQGIQIIGMSPRNMRARVISPVYNVGNDVYDSPSRLTLRKAMDMELHGAQVDVILAVEQPDGEKVTCDILTISNYHVYELLLYC